MRAADVIQDVLTRSGLSKSELSVRSRVSRALIDGYLSGRRQPSVAQLSRLVEAADLRISVELKPKPRPVPPEFLAVLEFGEPFPIRARGPLTFPHQVWKQRPTWSDVTRPRGEQ